MTDIIPITHALVSVYDKSGLDLMATFFIEQGITAISTGGSAGLLREHGVNVIDCATLGHCKEMLDGRVKTLTSRIHAGILFDRHNPSHYQTIRELDIVPIDLVVANFYPFLKVAQNPHASLQDLIEQIDIGGPTMLRAAAKNHHAVVAINEPTAYQDFITHYKQHKGTTLLFRQNCAYQVFVSTSTYDQNIAQALGDKCGEEIIESTFNLVTIHKKKLRYGENPHQQAHLYATESLHGELNLASLRPLQGKELSYNNLLDIHAAVWALRCLADGQTGLKNYAVVIKHGIPCGAASAGTLSEAVSKAIASDPMSAFGGILIASQDFDKSCVQALQKGFFEVIIASNFTDEARHLLEINKMLRLLPINNLLTASLDSKNLKSIFGGLLVQDQDITLVNQKNWQTVSQKKPSLADGMAMEFAWRMVKATPSNAIVVASSDQVLGVGSGQPNRIQSTELAIKGALSRGFSLPSAALASDAFFPFADCIELAHRHGLRLIIEPGGSIRDQQIIEKADALGMCVVFTKQRHFLH